MRRGLLLSVLAGLALVGLALPPGTARAVPTAFTAQLTIEIETLAPFTDPMPASGVSNVIGQSFTIPASEVGAFGLQTIVGSTFFTQIVVTVLNTLPGTFTTSGGPMGGLGGRLPLAGTALFGGPGGTLSVFLDPIGSGGTTSYATGIGGTTVTVSVTGTGWTVGFASATGFTPTGMRLSAMTGGFDTPTPSGRQIQLVTPFRIIRRENGGAPSQILPGVAKLRVTLAPEPSRTALAAAGALVLIAVARRRARPVAKRED